MVEATFTFAWIFNKFFCTEISGHFLEDSLMQEEEPKPVALGQSKGSLISFFCDLSKKID